MEMFCKHEYPGRFLSATGERDEYAEHTRTEDVLRRTRRLHAPLDTRVNVWRPIPSSRSTLGRYTSSQKQGQAIRAKLRYDRVLERPQWYS